MVSIATKFSMFTMFSTMALGRQLASADDLGSLLNDQLEALQSRIWSLNAQQFAQGGLILALEGLASNLESRQITGDFFKINDAEIDVPDHPIVLANFKVKAGETLDFMANVTTHDDY